MPPAEEMRCRDGAPAVLAGLLAPDEIPRTGPVAAHPVGPTPTPAPVPRHHFLAFVTRIKREHSYLPEWLAYHRLVGVDHFYLYDMDDDDSSRGLLAPYEARGWVTRIPWARYEGSWLDGQHGRFHPTKSTLAHRHFVHNFGDAVLWAQLIDADEFLYPLEGDEVQTPMRAYDPGKVRGVTVPRVNFGDSGHESRPPGLVIESYLLREAGPSQHKEAGNPAFISRLHWMHGSHRWKYRWWNGGRTVPRDEVTGLRINHYFSKSFEEFRLRQNTSKTRRQDREQFEARNRTRNEVRDEGMLRFVPAVKDALARGV